MNMKHLKLKLESLRCADLALLDEFVTSEKRNVILKVRLSLFADVHRMIKKSKKDLEKANKKRNKKPQIKRKGVVKAPQPRIIQSSSK